MTLLGLLVTFYMTVVTIALVMVTALLVSARSAIKEYKRMIEETRQGNPPFLLNRGVEIIRRDDDR